MRCPLAVACVLAWLATACVVDPSAGSGAPGPILTADVVLVQDSAPAADQQTAGPPDAQADVPPDASPDAETPLLPMPPAQAVFDPHGLHQLEITLDPAQWQAYLAGVAAQPKKYAWHHAQVTWDGKAYGEVGIRGFGNGSQQSNPGKPNVRIKWDAWQPKKDGPDNLHQVRLKASGQDSTFLREPLVYDFVRALGGYAPRYGWARLRVNGEDFGFYQVLEHADKRMYAHLFDDDTGNEYEPDKSCMGLNCPPEGCAALATYYEGDPGTGEELAALAQVVASTPDAQWLPELQARTHLASLLALYAVDATVSNLDGLASAGQNFRVYVDPVGDRIALLASGADLTFGAWSSAYDPMTPWGAPNSWCQQRVDHLYQRLWQAPATQPLLLAAFRKLQCGPFHADVLLPKIEQMRQLVLAEVLADPKADEDAQTIHGKYASLVKWVTKRQATLQAAFGACP